jgi:hypothetical protein
VRLRPNGLPSVFRLLCEDARGVAPGQRSASETRQRVRRAGSDVARAASAMLPLRLKAQSANAGHHLGEHAPQRIRMALGGSPSMIDKFPDRPKGMHEKTFRELRSAHDRAAERCMAGPHNIERTGALLRNLSPREQARLHAIINFVPTTPASRAKNVAEVLELFMEHQDWELSHPGELWDLRR